jgi:hypothetical protein
MVTLAEIKVILTAGQQGLEWAGLIRRCLNFCLSQNRRGLLRLFPFANAQIVVPAQQVGPDVQLTTEHDNWAADYIKTALKEIDVKYSVLNSSRVTSVPEENLILICGPAANMVSRMVFEKSLPIRI